jgi:hypothetical protein
MAGHGSKEDFIGATTYLMTFPERGLVVAVMANISFADTKSIALNVAQTFAEQKRSPRASDPPTAARLTKLAFLTRRRPPAHCRFMARHRPPGA